MKLIHSNMLEDFLKIFLPTLVVAFFYFQFQESTNFLIILLGFTFFIDTGHVYTTYVETFLDKEENKKIIHYLVLIGAYLLNFIIYVYFNSLFYNYIFYYTVFHNARQGLGVSLLYSQEKDKNFKIIYYFLTFLPLILFHFISPFKETIKIGEGIFKSLNFSEYIDQSMMTDIVYMYWIMCAFFLYKIYKQNQNIQSYLVAYYFGLLYSLSFLVIKDPIFAFAILVVSHSIPYVFLMDKRVKRTHTLSIVKKYSLLFIMLFFLLGGTVEYFYQDILFGLNKEIYKYLVPLFWTPTIGHFIIDSYIWTNKNNKMRSLKDSTK